MTEKIIQRELRRLFGNYEYKLFNSYMFAWESDFFCISKSGYSTEVEIKCSKADFKKDFTHKVEKHLLLKNFKKPAILQRKRPFTPHLRRGETEFVYGHAESSYVDFCCPANHIPNKFYYACPEGLISLEDLPPYAGLIYVMEFTNQFGTGYNTREIKRAPFLHKNVKSHTSTLLSKYYYKHLNDRNDIIQLLHVIDKDNLTDFQKSAIRMLRHKLS